MNYEHTHQSIRDASPAMFLFEDNDANTYTLVNECGDVFVVSQDDWISIAEVTQENYDHWTAMDEADYYDPMGYNSDSYINYLNGDR